MRDLDIATVIVTYKSAELTVNALRSINAERQGTPPRIRVFVVDNASGDLPVVAKAIATNGWSSWVTLIEAPMNGGFAYGNNLGIDHSYAGNPPDYVYLLNPDAEVRPGAIGTLAQFLETNPQVGIAGSSFENPDGSDWPIAFRFPTLLSEVLQGVSWGVLTRVLRQWEVPRYMGRSAERVDWICGASMMIRPTVLATIGGLDENYFLYFEETDFCYRASQAGFHTWYVPGSRVMHIMGQSTQVTDLRGGRKRLPSYWFDSRRRYFGVTFGMYHAMAIDLAACLAHSLGLLKQMILGRRRAIVPHFIRDLIQHSQLWPENRVISPPRCLIRRLAK